MFLSLVICWKELEYILSRRKCKIGGERDLRRGVGEVRFGKEDKINRRELGRSAHLYVPLASDNLSSAMHVRVTTVWLETANRELPLAIKGKASGTYRHDAKLPYVSICEWSTRRNTRHFPSAIFILAIYLIYFRCAPIDSLNQFNFPFLNQNQLQVEHLLKILNCIPINFSKQIGSKNYSSFPRNWKFNFSRISKSIESTIVFLESGNDSSPLKLITEPVSKGGARGGGWLGCCWRTVRGPRL